MSLRHVLPKLHVAVIDLCISIVEGLRVGLVLLLLHQEGLLDGSLILNNRT